MPPDLPQEVFTELQERYGDIEEMNVCDNLGDHLVGNVYVKVPAFLPVEPTGGGISVPPLKLHILRSIIKASPAPNLITNPLKTSEFDCRPRSTFPSVSA